MPARNWLPSRRATDASQFAKTMGTPGLTASGAPASGDNRTAEASAKSQQTRAAQAQVWAYRRVIGELAHAIQFYENTFSRIRLQIAVEEDDGSRTPCFDAEGKETVKGATEALRVLRALKSPLGGSSHIMRQIGGCLASVGEGHLVGVDNPKMAGKQAWEFLSPSEFHESQTQSNRKTEAGVPVVDYDWVKVPGQPPTKIGSDKAVIARVWQPDAEHSMLAWAAPMGMLQIFEELDLLTREGNGASKSRLVQAGILLVSNGLVFPESEDSPDDADDTSPFVAEFIKYASAAIRTPDSPAGTLPFVVEVDADQVGDSGADQAMRFIEFKRSWDDKIEGKKAECMRRFAQGMDCPPERVFGHTGTTFANATRISEDEWVTYVEPKARVATDGLTTGYLQTVLPGTAFVIDPDPTDLLARPDQTADYMQGHKLFVISDASLRDKLGATEADAPDDTEIAKRIAIAQAVRQAPQAEEPVTASGDIEAATDLYVEQSLHRIGARIRSKVSGKSGMASMIANVPDPEVAATLGPNTVAGLLSEAELFGRDFRLLGEWVTKRSDRVVGDQVLAEARDKLLARLYAPAGR